MRYGGAVSAVVGIVLAAGAGTRFGGPKALARDETGRPWIDRAVTTLRAGGCASVLVALGAGAEAAARLVPEGAAALIVPEWADGLGATLRDTLRATLREARGAKSPAAQAALIVPVDTPAMPFAVCERVAAGAGRASLARAVYGGVPGHPVLLGRDHWASVADSAAGDRGAGPYLRAHDATPIECGDLWDGADIDHPPETSPAGRTTF